MAKGEIETTGSFFQLDSRRSSGALALPGHRGSAALPLYYGRKAFGVHSDAEYENEREYHNLAANLLTICAHQN